MSCVLYRLCLKKQGRKVLAIHVALIDKSEIIHKMLTHCLHYFTVQVSRFDSLESCLLGCQDNKPSLVFIDWEMQKENQPLVYTAMEQFQSIPVVLLYRHTLLQEVYNASFVKKIPYRITKPINPKEVRDVCNHLIPELKNSTLHSFLKFPKTDSEKKKEQAEKTAQAVSTQKKEDMEKPKTKSFIGNLIEKTGLFKMPSPEEIESAEEFPDPEVDSPVSQATPPKAPGLQTETGLTSQSKGSAVSPVATPPKAPGFQTETGLTSQSKGSAVSPVATPPKAPGFQTETGLTSQSKGSAVSPVATPPKAPGFQTETGLTSQSKGSAVSPVATPPKAPGFQTETGLTSQSKGSAVSPATTPPKAPGFQTETGLTSQSKGSAVSPAAAPPKAPGFQTETGLTSQSKGPAVSPVATPPKAPGFQTETGLTSVVSGASPKGKEPGVKSASPLQNSPPPLSPKVEKAGKAPRFNKEDIKLDEDTKNDLAPMAMKSADPVGNKSRQGGMLSEKDILYVFNKYKDSLEFQKLMEKTLAGYAQSVVTGVLKGDSVKGILEKSLEDFKESVPFKQLIEKEISKYIQTQLPIVIKSVVETEIKKIIGD